MYIDINRLLRYNKATMEEGASKKGPPRREANMSVSKAQQKAVNKYVREKYDKLLLTMPKGRKDIIKAHAEANSESVNAFINRAIDEAIERDGANGAEEKNPGKTPGT